MTINTKINLRTHLVRGVLGTGGINAVQKAIGLLTVALLARVLGTKGYGYYAFAIAIVGFLSIPAAFGLPQLITREIAAAHARREWALMHGIRRWAYQLSALTTLVITIGLGSLPLIFAKQITALDPLTFSLALLLLPLTVAKALIGAALQGLRHVVHALWPDAMLRPILLLVLLWLFVSAGFDLRQEGAMAVNILAAIISTAILVKLLIQRWPAEACNTPASYQSRAWLRSLLPFTMLAGINIIANKIDILMLGVLTSPEDVGVYNVVVQGGMLVSFSLFAFNDVLAPNISRLYTQGDHHLLQRLVTRTSLTMFAAAVLTYAVLVVAGEWLLVHVFGPDFARGYWPLIIFGAGQLVNAGMGSVGFVLSMTGNERHALHATIATSFLNVLLNIFLIPTFGITGAAIATAISIVILNAIMTAQIYRRLKLVAGPIPRKFLGL